MTGCLPYKFYYLFITSIIHWLNSVKHIIVVVVIIVIWLYSVQHWRSDSNIWRYNYSPGCVKVSKSSPIQTSAYVVVVCISLGSLTVQFSKIFFKNFHFALCCSSIAEGIPGCATPKVLASCQPQPVWEFFCIQLASLYGCS